jgi:hypothetical protein
MTRLARSLAFAAWALTLALPWVAPAGATQVLMAEICSADGARTAPFDHRDAGHATECPCCTSPGAAALPLSLPATALPVDRSPSPDRRPATVDAASDRRLPPSCGPPA